LLPGGFLGVDIFFVISGYLMTQKIVGGLVQGQFSFSDFMVRRVRRIVPALLAWSFASVAFGVLIFAPDDLVNLAESALAAPAFFSNFYFFANTGYFDAAAASMPLLHTWSLGVEGQFYLGWPLFLAVAAFAWRPRAQYGYLPWIALATLVSFIIYFEASARDPQMAFFFPFGRIWEFGVGGIIAASELSAKSLLRKRAWSNTLAAWGALASLVLVIFFFDRLTGHSVLVSLAVVVLTGLLILFGGQPRRGPFVLSAAPVRGVGIISYSLYLAHWPIITFYRHYVSFEPLTHLEQAILLLVILVAAYLSWRFIEVPFRRRDGGWAKRTAAVLASVLFLFASASIVFAAGWPQRLPPAMQALADREVMWEWECPETLEGWTKGEVCAVGAPWNAAERHAVLWGDSHALHYAPLFDVAGRQANTSVVILYGCPAIIDNEVAARRIAARPNYSAECASERSEILDLIARRGDIDVVVLASFWSSLPRHLRDPALGEESRGSVELFEGALVKTVRQPELNGISVVLLGDFPVLPAPSTRLIDCARRGHSWLLRRPCDMDTTRISRTSVDRAQGPTQHALAVAAASVEDVTFHDAVGLWCDETTCPTMLNGEFLYRDGHHIRRNLSSETMLELSAALRLAELLDESARE
jgi:peptidoglycan/LPS O-acetylase OafA/YrhL